MLNWLYFLHEIFFLTQSFFPAFPSVFPVSRMQLICRGKPVLKFRSTNRFVLFGRKGRQTKFNTERHSRRGLHPPSDSFSLSNIPLLTFLHFPSQNATFHFLHFVHPTNARDFWVKSTYINLSRTADGTPDGCRFPPLGFNGQKIHFDRMLPRALINGLDFFSFWHFINTKAIHVKYYSTDFIPRFNARHLPDKPEGISADLSNLLGSIPFPSYLPDIVTRGRGLIREWLNLFCQRQ